MARPPLVLSCHNRPVTHVTLYRDRADVSRHLSGIAIEAQGTTVIQLKGIPEVVDLNSVRVELTQQPDQQQKFIIGDVSLALLPADPLPPTPSTPLAIETAEKRSRVTHLHAHLLELQAKLDVTLYLLSMVQEYANTQTQLKSNALDPVTGFLDGFMPGHERALRDLTKKKVKLDTDMKYVADQVSELMAWFTRTGTSVSEGVPAPAFKTKSVDVDEQRVKAVVVTVEPIARPEATVEDGKQQGLKEIELNVSYMIGNAGWTPSYDLHVHSAKEGDSTAHLQYHAVVKQSTGEDWLNSLITLSTASGSFRSRAGQAPPKFIRRWELNIKQPPPSPKPYTPDGSGGFAAFSSQSQVVFGQPTSLGGSATFPGSSTTTTFGSQLFGSSNGVPTVGFGGPPPAAGNAALPQAQLAASAAVSIALAFFPPAPAQSAPTATITSTTTGSSADNPVSNATHFAATYSLPLRTTIRSNPDTTHRLLITSIRDMPVTLSHKVTASSFKPAGATTLGPFFQSTSHSVECTALATLHAHLVNVSEFTLVPTTAPVRIILNGSLLTSDALGTDFGCLKDAVTPNARFSLALGPDRSVSVVRKPRTTRDILPVATGNALARMLAGGAATEAEDPVAKRLGADETGKLRSIRYVVTNRRKGNEVLGVCVKFDEIIPVAKNPRNRVEMISPSGDQVKLLDGEDETPFKESDGGTPACERAMALVYKQDGIVKFSVPVHSGRTKEIVYEYLAVRGANPEA